MRENEGVGGGSWCRKDMGTYYMRKANEQKRNAQHGGIATNYGTWIINQLSKRRIAFYKSSSL